MRLLTDGEKDILAEQKRDEAVKDCLYCGEVFEDTVKGTVDLMNHYEACEVR